MKRLANAGLALLVFGKKHAKPLCKAGIGVFIVALFMLGQSVFPPASGGGGGAAPAGSASEYQYRASSSTLGAVTNTGPVPTAGWTLTNATGAKGTLDDFSGESIGLTTAGTTTSNAWALASRSLGSAPYTIIARLRLLIYPQNGNPSICGIALFDGTKAYAIDMSSSTGIQISVETRQLATLATAGTAAGTTAAVAGTTVAFKIQDNGVNRIWSYWASGGWVQLLSETTATFLTPNAFGIIGLNDTGIASANGCELIYLSVN